MFNSLQLLNTADLTAEAAPDTQPELRMFTESHKPVLRRTHLSAHLSLCSVLLVPFSMRQPFAAFMEYEEYEARFMEYETGTRLI